MAIGCLVFILLTSSGMYVYILKDRGIFCSEAWEKLIRYAEDNAT